MLKKLALAALLAAGSSVAMADNDVGCGVGTQVWAGQKEWCLKFLLQQQMVFLLTNY